MNKKITLYPVHYLISMHQITNPYDIYKEVIGFSNVQELVSLSKIYVFRKCHLRENRRDCSNLNVIFR